MTNKNFPRRNIQYILTEKKDGGTIYHPYQGTAARVNNTGSFIWKLMNGKNSKKQITDKIIEKYEITETEAKTALDNYLQDLKDAGLLFKIPVPQVCIFAITGRCNLRCKHCCASETWGNKDISTEKMLDIIDQIAELGVESVNIFGGEPLMRKDIFTLIKRMRAYNIQIAINTNATLITPVIAAEFKQNDVKTFTVSLDGALPEAHDRMRGKGAFVRAMRGIENLLSADLNVIVSFIITKINQNEIEKIADLGKELGVKKVRYNHVFYTGNAPCYEEELFINPVEDMNNCEKVYNLYLKYGGFIEGSYLKLYQKLQKLGTVKPETGVITVPPCGASVSEFAVRPDGRVTPCEILWETKAGDLKEKKLKDIWKNSKVMDDFRKTKSIELKEMKQCIDCKFQFICFQGHRCYPFYYPKGIKDKRLYCYKKWSDG